MYSPPKTLSLNPKRLTLLETLNHQAGAEDRGNICRKSALEVARHKAHPRCQALLVSA
jgi:hypothetical protein